MSIPERYKPLPYGEEGVIRGVNKIFDDPDFAQITLEGSGKFALSWATDKTADESLYCLGDMIKTSDFHKGIIVLIRNIRRPNSLTAGVNVLQGEAEDIINEIHESNDRIASYQLFNRDLELRWAPAWPKTFHDIPTNELSIRFKRRRSMSRFIVDQCISETALPGLLSSVDITLDEFAQYQPSLRS